MTLVDYLLLNPTVFLTFCTLIGLSVGSFLNVVAYRLPVMLDRDWKSQCRELLELSQTNGEETVFNLSQPPSRCQNADTGYASGRIFRLSAFFFSGGDAPPAVNLSRCAIRLWRRLPDCSR